MLQHIVMSACFCFCFTFGEHGKMKVWISPRDCWLLPPGAWSPQSPGQVNLCRPRWQLQAAEPKLSWKSLLVSLPLSVNEWLLLERPFFDLWSCGVFEAGRARPDSGAGLYLCFRLFCARCASRIQLLCVTVSRLNHLHLEEEHHFSEVYGWNKLRFFPGALLTGWRRFPEKWRKISCYLSCAAPVLPLILYNGNEARNPNWVTCCFKINPLLLHFYWINQ